MLFPKGHESQDTRSIVSGLSWCLFIAFSAPLTFGPIPETIVWVSPIKFHTPSL